MIGGGRDGGVGTGNVGCVALLFSMGVPELGVGNVPRPLNPPVGWEGDFKGRGENGAKTPARCAKPAHPSLISPGVAPKPWA